MTTPPSPTLLQRITGISHSHDRDDVERQRVDADADASASAADANANANAKRALAKARPLSHNYSGPTSRAVKAFLIAATVTMLALITTAATSGTIDELRNGLVDTLGNDAATSRVVLDGSAPRKDCGVTQEAWNRAIGLEKRDPCRDGGAKVADLASEIASAGLKDSWALVTGGAGFIGAAVVKELLELGVKVRVLDDLSTGSKARLSFANEAQQKGRFQLVEGDVRAYADVQRAFANDVMAVFHLAAVSKVRPTLDLTREDIVGACVATNVMGTENVLRAARARDAALAKSEEKVEGENAEARRHVRIVYAGSSTYYGNQPTPFDEERTHLRTTTTPYATTKAQGEDLARLYYTMYGVQAVVTRLFMVYGPGEPSEGEHAAVTGRFFSAAARGEALEIEGDGEQFRDFIHVDDAARGLVLAALAPEAAGRTVNIGSGTSVTIRELADMISDKHEFVPARENDLKGTLASTCLAKRMLGFQATKDLESYVHAQKRAKQ